ncbi:hypothetical protein V6N12_060248 [Hibiscus sabdariffa]|uniref:Uncharacterized protein n=1 Tax=Hibiscus sabdariffa TaxID=183260 RepID=A0ABR2D4A2_9ROSI
MERGLGAWSLKLNLLRHWLLFNTWLCLALQSAFQLGFLPGACIRPGMFLSPYLSLWEDISIAMDVIFLGDIYILSWKVSLDVGKSNRRKCKWASGNEIGTKQSRSPSFVKYCWRNIRELLQPVKADRIFSRKGPFEQTSVLITQETMGLRKYRRANAMSSLVFQGTFMDVNIALKVQLQSAELCANGFEYLNTIDVCLPDILSAIILREQP